MIVEIVDFKSGRIVKVYKKVQEILEGIHGHILIKTENVNYLFMPREDFEIKVTKHKD